MSNRINTLTRLSPSPSPSTGSLTSEEGIFDPHVTVNESEPPVLGVRELLLMAKLESRDGRIASSGGIQLLQGDQSSERRRIDVAGQVGNGGIDVVNETFARDVMIKGWKTVGGKNWTDQAKMGAYVVYDIEIILRSGGNISILRRYTDFVNLRKALKETNPHLKQAIPQLPGKAHMSKFLDKFLAERQPRLQRFLRAILLHPEMGKGGPGSVVGAWITGRTPGNGQEWGGY